jgi:hypothetical protein
MLLYKYSTAAWSFFMRYRMYVQTGFYFLYFSWDSNPILMQNSWHFLDYMAQWSHRTHA